MSNISVKNKNEIIINLETLYTEKESFNTLSLYDPDYTKKQGIQYFVHEKIISKFKSFGMNLTELEEKSFHQPFLEYDMKDTLKIQKKSIKSVEKGYFLFSLIYPYYLAKFGFDLQNSKNICVGPYITRDNKNKKEIKIDSNYNESAMLSFAIETSSHNNEEEKEDEKSKQELQTGGKFNLSEMKKKSKISNILKNISISKTQEIKAKIEEMEAQEQLRSLTEIIGKKNSENNNSKNENDLIKQQIQLKLKQLEDNAFMQKKEYEKTIKELKLKIYKTQDNDDKEDTNSLLDNLSEKIREMDKKISQSEEMKKLAQGIKKLYTIFTFYSFKQIKKNKKYKQLIFGFLRAEHDTRVKIIQGTMSNQPVYESLRNYFKDSKKKPSNPLKFHYFFGLSDVKKIPAFMKSIQLQNNTNSKSVLNATNIEAKNIVQEQMIESKVVNKGGSKNKTIRKIILKKRTHTKKNLFRRILKKKLNKYKKKKQFTRKVNSGYRWIKSRKIKTK